VQDYLDVQLKLSTAGQGRSTPVWPRGRGSARYMPHLRVREGEYLGVAFVGGPEILEPGQSGECTLILLYRDLGVDYSDLQPGVEFEVLEGPKRVGLGRVLRRYQSEKDGPDPRGETA